MRLLQQEQSDLRLDCLIKVILTFEQMTKADKLWRNCAGAHTCLSYTYSHTFMRLLSNSSGMALIPVLFDTL